MEVSNMVKLTQDILHDMCVNFGFFKGSKVSDYFEFID